MALIETFLAYDEQQVEYRVNVFGTWHLPISGERTLIGDYSLADTGEVLEQIQGKAKVFRIKSTGTLIVDIRDANV